MFSVKEVLSNRRLELWIKEDSENFKWLLENYEKLIEKYRNKYIAIRKQKVIASSKNVAELQRRLKTRIGDTSDVLIHFITDKEVKFLF
jgi:hypothetical protein